MALSKLFSSDQKPGVEVSVDPDGSDSDVQVIHDGDLAYTRAKGGNGSKPSYQEAVGAPVESNSPLGYKVGWLTVIFLNVNMMIVSFRAAAGRVYADCVAGNGYLLHS